MNHTTYYVTNSLLSIDACWELENKQLTLVEYGIKRELPTIRKEHQHLLDILNISYVEKKISFYNQSVSVLEIKDDSCFKEEEFTLPVYKKVAGKYQCINPSYTAKTCTLESIEKAKKLYDLIHKKIEEFEMVRFWENIFLQEKSGTIVKHRTWKSGKYSHYASYQVCYKDKDGSISISTVPYLTILVNLDKVDAAGNIDIFVPNDISIGKLVGQKGWQAKRIADFLGVRHVTFKSVES